MNPKKMTIRDAMIHAFEMGQKSGKPMCYYWRAFWWWLDSKESKNPSESIGYSRNHMALYKDMRQRPGHYVDPLRPVGISDWQWGELKAHDIKNGKEAICRPTK